MDDTGNFTAGTIVGNYEDGVTVEVTQGSVTKTATARVTIEAGPIDRVLLSPTAVTLGIGQNQEFSVQAVNAFDNSIPEAQLTWEAAQAGTISAEGLLTTGTLAGTFDQGVKATATLGTLSAEATASVTVTPDPLSAVTVAPVQIAGGGSRQLEIIATGQYGNRLSGVGATWTVRDANAGAVTQAGLFTAGEVAGSFSGAVEVEATQGDLTNTATTSVTIRPGLLEQVVIATGSVEIGLEMTQQYVAVGADRFGNRISGLAFTWSVAAGGGTIDGNGLFTVGTKPGTYQGTVNAQTTQGDVNRSATASVTVEPDRIVFISDQNDGLLDVFLMNVDGTNVQRITNKYRRTPFSLLVT